MPVPTLPLRVGGPDGTPLVDGGGRVIAMAHGGTYRERITNAASIATVLNAHRTIVDQNARLRAALSEITEWWENWMPDDAWATGGFEVLERAHEALGTPPEAEEVTP